MDEKTIKSVSEIEMLQNELKVEGLNSVIKMKSVYGDLVDSEIEIPEKFLSSVEIQSDFCVSHKVAMNHHAAELNDRNKKMWALIKTACHVLDFENFEYIFNHETKRLKCIDKINK